MLKIQTLNSRSNGICHSSLTFFRNTKKENGEDIDKKLDEVKNNNSND